MSGWSYRKEITIDSAKVDGDLTDFPILVYLDSDSDLAEHAQSSGDDIKFEDPNGNQLSHEIESYDGSTGTLWAHVKALSLSSSSDTTLYIYYGNSGASNQESAADVWSNAYDAVYHLNESASGTGNADVYKDSTANNYHGDDDVSASGQTGQVAAGQAFDGTDDTIPIPYGSGVTGDQTITAWVRTTSAGHIVNPYQNRKYNLRLQYDSGTTLRAVRYDGNSAQGDVQVNVDLSSLTHVAGQYDAGDGVVRLFASGGQIGSDPNSTDITTADGYYIASQEGSKKLLDGVLDEIRFSSVVRSEAWIATSQTNQNDPLSFYSVGTEKQPIQTKQATTSGTATTTASSTQIEQRTTETNAAVDTQSDATQVLTLSRSVSRGESTVGMGATLPQPAFNATTPTALTTEVATTATEQARASVTTAKSTAIETKSRVLKIADVTAAATAPVAVSVPAPSTPAAALLTASPRAALTPRETTPNRRALDGTSDTEAAYQTASDRVEYDEQTDKVDYGIR